jgi:hypothetical protein
VTKRAQRQLPADPIRRFIEKSEQVTRRTSVEDAPEALMLDDGLRTASEMAQIGKAHAIDAGRQAAFPATPDQPRHIEQKGSVVGQEI